MATFGPLTLAAAFNHFKPGDEQVPGHMLWAANQFGISEIFGAKKNNPQIVHYHSFTDLSASTDEVAWCASFVNAGLLEGAGILGTRSAAAASFKKYGKDGSKDPAAFGNIILFRTETGSKRHVAFSAGSWKGFVFSLGGNQSNRVNVQVRPVSDITESRIVG